jgi:hypothetical protein
MEPIELVLAFGLGLAVGYAIRAAISAIRRQKAYHYRREHVRVAAESARRLRAAETAMTAPTLTDAPQTISAKVVELLPAASSWLPQGQPAPEQFPVLAGLAPAPLGRSAP